MKTKLSALVVASVLLLGSTVFAGGESWGPYGNGQWTDPNRSTYDEQIRQENEQATREANRQREEYDRRSHESPAYSPPASSRGNDWLQVGPNGQQSCTSSPDGSMVYCY